MKLITEIKDFFHTRLGRLASTYLAIIMAMTVIFSGVVFEISSVQLSRPVRPDETVFVRNPWADRQQIHELLERRANDQRVGLIVGLVGLNLVVFVAGAWFSVYLARKTLAPIERAMAEQARFVSDASHELRTPLTALQSMNEVVLRRKTITDAQARELAMHNVDEVKHLHALTSSLLGLVRADQTDAVVSAVRLQEVVSDALALVVDKAQAKKLTVEDAVADVRVMAPSEQLAQVVRILLDNAVKYSKQGGGVTLWTEVKEATVRLHVSDDGIGIAKEQLPHIFSRFYRVDDARSKDKADGYGLGLAIAKTISDRYEMHIAAASEVGKGSTFSIDLPVAQPTKIKEK